MYPQLRYCLNQQKKHLVGKMKRSREERINMLQTSCDGEQPNNQRVIVYTIPLPTVLGSTFKALSNRLIITTEERKVPKSKTWILLRSITHGHLPVPKAALERPPNSSLEYRTVSYRYKIYNQEIPAHPRAEA